MRYRSPAWMRLYRQTMAETAKPLPFEGGLCDQTPEGAPGDRSRCATCAEPITVVPSADGPAWTHDTPVGGDHYATPTLAGRWQPRHDNDATAGTDNSPEAFAAMYGVTADLHALDDRRSLEDRYLAVCQQLREVTADRDRLEHVNDGLRTALATLGRRLDTAGPLRVADDDLLIQPLPKEAGR